MGLQLQEARRLFGRMGKALNDLGRLPAAGPGAREVDAVAEQLRGGLKALQIGIESAKHDFCITKKIEQYGEKVVRMVEGAKTVDEKYDARFEFCEKLEKKESAGGKSSSGGGGNGGSKPSSRNSGGSRPKFAPRKDERRRSRSRDVRDRTCYNCGLKGHEKKDCKKEKKRH
jgi:hypothetical protein